MIEPSHSENDSRKVTLRLLDRLLDQHENIIINRVGLDRDDVLRLTAKMKRENFVPTKGGAEAIVEFLEAGFTDCSARDFMAWGIGCKGFAKTCMGHPKLRVETRWVMNEYGNRSAQSIFNLAKPGETTQIAQHAKGERQKDRRLSNEYSRGGRAKATRTSRGAKRKQSGTPDHQG